MVEYPDIAYFISKDLISKSSIGEIYEKIAITANTFIKCDLATIFMLSEETETIKCIKFYRDGNFIQKDFEIMLGEGIIGSVVENGEPLISKDLKSDLSDIYYELEKQFSGMASILSVPVYAGSLVLGALNVYTEVPHEFTEEEIEIAKFIALMGGVFIYSLTLYENANFLYLRQKEESRKVENLLEVSRLVSSSLDLASVLDHSVKSLMSFTNTSMSLAYFKDEAQILPCYEFFNCNMKGCSIYGGSINCYTQANFECPFVKCPPESKILRKCVECPYLLDITLKLFKSYGIGEEQNISTSFKLKECSCVKSLNTGYPAIIHCKQDRDNTSGGILKIIGKRSNNGMAAGTADPSSTFIAIPIRTDKDFLGIIFLFDYKEINYSVETVDFISSLAGIVSVAISNAQMVDYIEEAHFGAINSMSEAIEARDAYTRTHGDRLINYGIEVAKELNLGDNDIKNIRYAAALHDVGKIGIKDSILNKRGKLTDEEYAEMKKHPEIGYNMLKKIKFLTPIANEVLHHQERYDGNGYPDKLKGEDIPIVSRIIAVIDAFDAMTTDRPYRKAIPIQAALDELKKNSGTQFDPKVVNAFLKVVGQDLNPLKESSTGFRETE
ncbi:MAG: GAF domain-containing protein [Deltaproteobacteria bacterium]|jgi:HD-GYP domain-containing protein (c-di-GMP phosphodiesterase class II)|nr:GAF domain-containing protein [Deltaproteobacteria bacterium]MCL5880806.1 GAF domain-containing protein [Deltaproteobacteria bacterium]MDA8304272.1 GAF domain-containing protein [Deltaproteobacteria bacterium]